MTSLRVLKFFARLWLLALFGITLYNAPAVVLLFAIVMFTIAAIVLLLLTD